MTEFPPPLCGNPLPHKYHGFTLSKVKVHGFTEPQPDLSTMTYCRGVPGWRYLAFRKRFMGLMDRETPGYVYMLFLATATAIFGGALWLLR